ncbi:glycosyltransferase [Azospirillum argentinense]|uniref:Glycosyltransferase n=1 Tax=Azospirillum argentinense TaxID=2970906 RepID=A0ABW8VGF6_9PROT
MPDSPSDLSLERPFPVPPGDDRPRILFVIDHLGTGGIQEFILNYCRRVPQHRVIVLSLFANDLYSDALRGAGAEVVRLTDRPYGYGAVLDPRQLFAFRAFFRSGGAGFDQIHIKMFAGFLYASLLGLYRDRRVSAGVDATSRQLPVPLRVLLFLFARFYRRFYVPSWLRDDFRYLGLKPEAYRPQNYFVTMRRSDTPHPFTARYNLLTIGRCIGQKGHLDAIRFFQRLRPALGGDAALWVVGDGPHMPALRAEVSRLSLEDAVHFTGTVGNLDDYMIACDAVLKMAHGEGHNSILREAVLLGKPVLSTLETASCHRLAEDALIVPIDRAASDGAVARAAAALTGASPDSSRRLREQAGRLWCDEAVVASYLAP